MTESEEMRPAGRDRTTDAEPILRAENLTKYFDAGEGFIDSLLGRSQFFF